MRQEAITKKKLRKATLKLYLIFIGVIMGTVFSWVVLVRGPQMDVASTFLEALRTRDANLLRRVVAEEEYPVYKELYLRNGFNKHLISYDDLHEKDANDYFFPTETRFGVRVVEDDIFFGRRTNEYMLVLRKMQDGNWRVIQFATLQDYADLEALKDFNPQPATRIH